MKEAKNGLSIKVINNHVPTEELTKLKSAFLNCESSDV